MKNSGRGGARSGGGRPSRWQHRPTQTIRVPQIFADVLLEIAKELDQGFRDSLVIDPKALKINRQIKQDVLASSQIRVYKSSGHKVLRLEELMRFLQSYRD